jgi:hypothetical protein
MCMLKFQFLCVSTTLKTYIQERCIPKVVLFNFMYRITIRYNLCSIPHFSFVVLIMFAMCKNIRKGTFRVSKAIYSTIMPYRTDYSKYKRICILTFFKRYLQIFLLKFFYCLITLDYLYTYIHRKGMSCNVY